MSNMLIIFLSNAFISPLYWLCNPFYILALFKRKSLEKQYKPDEKTNMNQKELNKLYENPGMEISFKYSYIAKTFLMTIFYIPIFPLGVIISLFGLSFAYFVEKFNLLYRYKRPEMLNSQIGKYYINNYRIMLFAFAVGNYIFQHDSYINKTWPIVCLVVFGGLILIPVHSFLTFYCLGIDETEVLDKKYLDAYFEFGIDYQRANPLSTKKGVQIYLERLKEADIITSEEYEHLCQVLDKEQINILNIYYRNSANIAIKAISQIKNMFIPKIKR